VEFSNTITIERSRHDVFEFLSDLENAPKWNYAIVETRKTSDGPVGVGTTYRQVRSLPSRSEETLQVTELEPDRRFSVHGGLGPFEGTLSYELEEIGGSTRLTNGADLEAHGIKRLATPIVSGRIRDAVAANLETLKQLLEGKGTR
jgi:carbon monoxide dehydrogenase subunit G